MKKSCATFIFLSHFATMAIDSANPAVLTLLFFPKPSTTFLTCFCRGERCGKEARVTSTYTWFGVKSYLFTTQSRLLTTSKQRAFENIVGNGENAGYQHFLVFPQCFLPFQEKKKSIFQSHLFCRLQMFSIWTSLKFCRLVNPFRNTSF